MAVLFSHYSNDSDWLTAAHVLQFAKHFDIVPDLMNIASFQELLESIHREVVKEAAAMSASHGDRTTLATAATEKLHQAV